MYVCVLCIINKPEGSHATHKFIHYLRVARVPDFKFELHSCPLTVLSSHIESRKLSIPPPPLLLLMMIIIIIIKITVFRNMTPCSMGDQLFGGTCCLHRCESLKSQNNNVQQQGSSINTREDASQIIFTTNSLG
jgi:hypothetical protein